jgi:hypothetical protein
VADTTANTPVPDAGFDRLLEALWRSRKYLDAEKARKIDELWSIDTFIAFGVLLALWGGLQLTPVGWLADTALAIYGTYQLGSTLGSLLAAAKEAWVAVTDQALELAAQHLAHAMSDTVVDVIAAILGAALFGRLRGLIKPLRARLLPKGSRFLEAEGSPRLKPEEPAPRPKALDIAVGAGVGVGLTHGAVALGGNPWPWVAGIVALAGVGLLIAGLASQRSAPRRAYG